MEALKKREKGRKRKGKWRRNRKRDGEAGWEKFAPTPQGG